MIKNLNDGQSANVGIKTNKKYDRKSGIKKLCASAQVKFYNIMCTKIPL